MRVKRYDFAAAFHDRRSRRPLHRGNRNRSRIFGSTARRVLAVHFLSEANTFHDAPDDQIEMPLTETLQNTS